MTERWKQELTKLRQAPELPEDLWSRVGEGPRGGVADPRSWRRAATIVLAFAVVIPILVFAWAGLRPLHQKQIVPTGSDALAIPAIGHAAPANLADGRPVFVVHHPDGSVSVIDGFSTHVTFGMSKLIAWCPASLTFEDIFHGSKWDANGYYMFGPAPTGLLTYATTLLPDGQVNAGSPIAPAPRGAGKPPTPTGPFCVGSGADLVYPTLPTRVFTSPSGVVGASPSGWVAVKGTLVDVGGRAELCASFSKGAGCQDAALVRGIDVSGSFGRNSAAWRPETFVARVEVGSLVDLAVVPVPGCCPA